MAKLLLVLLIAFSFEAVGVVWLKKGIDEIKRSYLARQPTLPVWKNALKLVGDWFTNPRVLLGLLLETIFFVLLQYLMSQRDLSFIWPLTAVSFVMTTLLAHFILHEKVDAVRWGGVILIVLGAALISYGENSKNRNPEITAPTENLNQ